MSKIALMTIYQVDNYGSVLQTFASQILLQELGHQCHIIRYSYPNEWHYKNGFTRPGYIAIIKKKLSRILNIRHGKLHNQLKLFRKENLIFTRRFHNLSDLKKFKWSEYDVIIAGSDQIWNPRFLKGDRAFMLDFGDDIRKISLASSFATDNIPKSLISDYKLLLSKFYAISLREENGINILENTLQLQLPHTLMLDPTLLVSKESWIKYLNLAKCTKTKSEYILLYILSYAFDCESYIYEFLCYIKSRYPDKEIISLSHLRDKKFESLNIRSVGGCSVEDFVNFFRCANLVITSSFHGTAFALNFGRKLVSITPKDGDDRQYSLLKRLEVENCCLKVGEDFHKIDINYNVEDEQKKLNHLRERDIAWIKDIMSK